METNKRPTIRVQIPHSKFGVIEVSGIEYTPENMEFAKQLIEKHKLVEEQTYTAKTAYAPKPSTQNGNPKTKVGQLYLSDNQINKIKGNGWTLEELSGLTDYNDLGKYITSKK